MPTPDRDVKQHETRALGRAGGRHSGADRRGRGSPAAPLRTTVAAAAIYGAPAISTGKCEPATANRAPTTTARRYLQRRHAVVRLEQKRRLFAPRRRQAMADVVAKPTACSPMKFAGPTKLFAD